MEIRVASGAEKRLPKKPPRLSDFLKLLASLGGYHNRATEAPPGPQAIRVGLRRMFDDSRAGLAFGPETSSGVVCKRQELVPPYIVASLTVGLRS